MQLLIERALSPDNPYYLRAETSVGLVIVGPFRMLAPISSHVKTWKERGEVIHEVKVVDASDPGLKDFQFLIWPDRDTIPFAALANEAEKLALV